MEATPNTTQTEGTATPATKRVLTPTEQQKVALWGNMGLAIHDIELRLQAMAQQSLAKIKIPTTIEEVNEAESLIKILRSDYTNLQNERKKITSRFDSVATRMALPEKTLLDSVIPITNAIIAIKKADEEKKRVESYKTDEAKRIREFFINNATTKDFEFKSKIAAQVLKAYTYALDKGGITELTLEEYVGKCKEAKGFSEVDFTYDKPAVTKNYHSDEEVLAIWHEVDKNAIPGINYVNDYHLALKNQFEFFGMALKNKVDALKAQKETAEKAAADLALETEAKKTATALESVAVTLTPTVTTETKALKFTYEIDMPDDDESAIKIIAAFVGNFKLCREEVRVTSLLNLSVGQMGSSLCAVKKKDEKFNCGINFKKVDKL